MNEILKRIATSLPIMPYAVVGKKNIKSRVVNQAAARAGKVQRTGADSSRRSVSHIGDGNINRKTRS